MILLVCSSNTKREKFNRLSIWRVTQTTLISLTNMDTHLNNSFTS